MIDLDELRSVQSRERQTDSLQQLRETFYQDAGEFIQQLHRERERAAEQADDPWDAPEVNRLSDDIDTAEQTVEAIYERRVGKIVKMASLAAADMPTEDEGLTAEERDLFDSLVASIEQNRASVEAVIEGEDPAQAAADAGPDPTAQTRQSADASQGAPDPAPDGTTDPTPSTATDPTADSVSQSPVASPDGEATASANDEGARSDVPTDPGALGDDAPPAPPAEPDDGPSNQTPGTDSGVDAADLMGGDGPDSTTPPTDDGPEEPGQRADRGPSPQADGGTGAVADAGGDRSQADDGPSSLAPEGTATAEPSDQTAPDRRASGNETPTDDQASSEEAESVARATVKITSDVGEIFGVDQRSYDLSTEDVVQLPEANAGPLVERDAAERLD